MKIFTNAQLQGMIDYTVSHDGVSLDDLVERVGEAVSEAVSQRFKPDRRIVVFAGHGLNGAYALATSRLLVELGYRPEIFLLNVRGNMLCQATATQRQLLIDTGTDTPFNEVIKTFDPPELDEDCCVIDGISGIELQQPYTGLGVTSLIDIINESEAYVVSIDIPSGLCGDWNSHSLNRHIIQASLTLAVGLPRVSFFLSETAPLIGRWQLLDIGLSEDYLREQPAQFYVFTRHNISQQLEPREAFTDKNQLGHLCLFAGSYGMVGAAILAASAALRGGCGKVTVHAPRCANIPLQTAVPCAMMEADADNVAITDFTLQRKYEAVAIGPGMGTAEATMNALEAFLTLAMANRMPLVLDADALNCLAKRPTMLDHVPAFTVLTPHAGEFDRIFGQHDSSQARLRKAIEMAKYYRIFIVLKGHNTAIVRPDGIVSFCATGCPAMATPGSGDVLTGLIGALLAQGYNADTASVAACYIHGIAGEMAANIHGDYGVTAMDIADNLGRAIKSIFES